MAQTPIDRPTALCYHRIGPQLLVRDFEDYLKALLQRYGFDKVLSKLRS